MSYPAEQEEASLLWQELLQAKPTAQSSVFSAIRGLKKQMRQDRISHLRSIDLDARFVSLTRSAVGGDAGIATSIAAHRLSRLPLWRRRRRHSRRCLLCLEGEPCSTRSAIGG